jgi:K+-sensing histidine kinase KdpD
LAIKLDKRLDVVQQLRETLHDMRQPIAIMMALAAAALAEPDLPAAARRRLEQVIEQAEWLSGMIQSDPAEPQREGPHETGKPGRDLADVVRVVGEVIETGGLTWPGDITLAAPDEPVWCTVDPLMLRRAVSNVLDNAARAAGPAGSVSVEIQRSDGAVMLAVEDSGPGFGEIPSEAGLGLASVARSVIRNGGKVEYGCGARGGARVSIWLL